MASIAKLTVTIGARDDRLSRFRRLCGRAKTLGQMLRLYNFADRLTEPDDYFEALDAATAGVASAAVDEFDIVDDADDSIILAADESFRSIHVRD